MGKFSVSFRLSIGLASLALTVLLAARTCGLLPDPGQARMRHRAALAETLAIHCSLLAQQGEIGAMEAELAAIVERNRELRTAGVRRADGRLLAEAGGHELHWQASATGNTDDNVVVPVTQGERLWGTVELCFRPLSVSGLGGYLNRPLVRLLLFVAAASLLVYLLYLQRMLQHLDPSKVIPARVRAALDTLASGLLVLDKEERIVLANRAFAQSVGRSSDELQGRRASQLPWLGPERQGPGQHYPWTRSLHEGVAETGVVLGLRTVRGDPRKLMVNSTPILDDDGESRGALASFDDVTLLERRNEELKRMLKLLKQSRDEIRRQNQELQTLATLDPLTGCLNRRSFFERFEQAWNAASRYRYPLSCAMVDIDHFKSINDRHGHSVGDQVLQRVAEVLKAAARDGDLVCRYGGEEFCVMLAHADMASACEAAERFRRAIQGRSSGGLVVTASVGVAERGPAARSPQELLEQADRALYAAKRCGRNRVMRFDQVPADLAPDTCRAPRLPAWPADGDVSIPFHAVTALISALGYRDAATAEHSRRVADLCVATASGLMSLSQCYVLEIAGLLHDIGKIGVPDSILLKPGPLTEQEWKVMQAHDRVGVEIIRAAFASEELTRIVENHHAWYGGNPRHPDLPTGSDIPLGARILSIADAYDAMVSDRVYRKRRSRQEAFDELRRWAGRQFDPAMVERFIQVLQSRSDSRADTLPMVPKQTALRIGLQIERLAGALDDRDLDSLEAMASRLQATAAKDGVPQIAELAERLQHSVAHQADLLEIVQLTTDLISLCRSTQRSYISRPGISDKEDGERSESVAAAAVRTGD